MTAFLSTFVNKVDRKGRVSVPAQFRSALSDAPYQGIIAYTSFAEQAIDAFGRSMLEELNRRRLEQNLANGEFEQALLGTNNFFDTIMGLAHELPFDGEGRIVLPTTLAETAGIEDKATFVGRGSRFQIWAPKFFEEHQRKAVITLRAKIQNSENGS